MKTREISKIIDIDDNKNLYVILAIREYGASSLDWDTMSDEESDAFDEYFKTSIKEMKTAAKQFKNAKIVPESEYDLFEKKGRKNSYAYFIYAPANLDIKKIIKNLPTEDTTISRTWRTFSEIAENEEEEIALDN